MESNPIQLAYSASIISAGIIKVGRVAFGFLRDIAADICRIGQARFSAQVVCEEVVFRGLRGRLGRSRISPNPAPAWEYSVQPVRAESSDTVLKKRYDWFAKIPR